MKDLESFERAFSAGISGCRRDCACGMTYWDSYNTGYDWEAGELDELAKLEKKGEARALPHSVGVIRFEGKHFVDGCSCWHERARQISSFLDSHAHAIAAYLTEEKKRKQMEADNAPVVLLEAP